MLRNNMQPKLLHQNCEYTEEELYEMTIEKIVSDNKVYVNLSMNHAFLRTVHQATEC